MNGDLGGGEGPCSGEAPGLALDQVRHWPPPCGCTEDCRVGVPVQRVGPPGKGEGDAGRCALGK